MKRAMLIVAAAALCVAGSATAQDRGGLIGSGTRTDDSGQVVGSGNAAGQTMGSGGFTITAADQYLGNGGRADSGQVIGSGGFTISAADQYMGSGGRSAESGQILGSGGRADDVTTTQDGGFLGSGNLTVGVLRLFDGSSLLVVSSDVGTFVTLIEE